MDWNIVSWTFLLNGKIKQNIVFQLDFEAQISEISFTSLVLIYTGGIEKLSFKGNFRKILKVSHFYID